MSYVVGLSCRICGSRYAVEPRAICDECFGPLEVDYDYDRIARDMSPRSMASRPPTMWRYREFLPLEGQPRVGQDTGFTPLVRADRLGAVLGLRNLYIKNDAVNHPTLSFKDRVVAVSISKALEFGFQIVGCASTGNLANSVAAGAAAAGLKAYIFVPEDLEAPKIVGTQVYGAEVIGIRGTYDDVNRLCNEIADAFPWALVNVNLRPFYAEGSKTMGFEIAEQLGWRAPDAVVVPMAGGALITRMHKAWWELQRVGLLRDVRTRMFGAQASGCNPIAAAVKAGTDEITPVKPRTIAKSLAIGNPADGYFAARLIRETGGWADDASDPEIVEGIELLAECEGIFTETAGGVTVAVTKKLVAQGRIAADDLTVIAITGNGLKTAEAVDVEPPRTIAPTLSDVHKLVERA
jgi:threonine synthase